MGCWSGVWSMVSSLWGCFDRHVTYIGDLGDNLESLKSERETLKNRCDDVRFKVNEAEGQQKRVRSVVRGWLEKVVVAEGEVNLILQEGDQELGNKCLGSCCPKNCWSSYKIGKNVLKMIPLVKNLTEEGRKFDVVADEVQPIPADEQHKEKLESLKFEMDKLQKLREDVKNRVKEAEEQTNQIIDGWLESVDGVEKKVEQILENLSFPSGRAMQRLPFPCDKVMPGYAYILTHPGTLSMFYDHFDDCALKDQIRTLADIRARNCITSTSIVNVLASDSDLYVAEIDNKVRVKIGPKLDLGRLVPSADFQLATSGTDYCVWEKKKNED